MSEFFAQWVSEDRFIAERPAWETVGAELVDSVLPYEEAKIRVLNATHSCVAWAGTLAGFEYIHEGTRDAEIAQFAHDDITQDVIPSLLPSPIDLYRARPLQQSAYPGHERTRRDGWIHETVGLRRPDALPRHDRPAPPN